MAVMAFLLIGIVACLVLLPWQQWFGETPDPQAQTAELGPEDLPEVVAEAMVGLRLFCDPGCCARSAAPRPRASGSAGRWASGPPRWCSPGTAGARRRRRRS